MTDDDITKSLEDSPKTNQELRSHIGIQPKDHRILDRALQKMRKKGQIRVEGRRWFATTTKVCPGCEGRGWVQE
jgi:exoribonuclease R